MYLVRGIKIRLFFSIPLIMDFFPKVNLGGVVGECLGRVGWGGKERVGSWVLLGWRRDAIVD